MRPCAHIYVSRIICAVTFAFLALARVAAQQTPPSASDMGSIIGSVTDQNHAALPTAEVILTNVTAGGVKLAIPLDEKGEFSIGNLFPGYYSLTVKAAGFTNKVWETLQVKPGGKLQLDAVLSPAPAPGAAPPPETAGATAAQEQAGPAADRAAISGTVTDQTQAVVPDAKAVLTTPLGEKLESPVNAKGVYSFSNLKPGIYELTITAPNFAPYPFESLSLAGGMDLTLDASLHPAAEKTEVNVESNSVSQVETENATVSGTITEKEVVSIGLNGRNFTQLIALAPGVSNQTGQDEAKVGVVGSVKYSVNGGRVEYNTFEVDGSDVLNTGLNGASSTLMVYPSLDAIQEVKVLTSNYGAQYGRTASGTVQVTTKSGTNAFHGNLYDFVRNEAFNARNFFDIVYTVPPLLGQTTGGKTYGTKAPLYRRQDFGGTIGGPLYIPHVYNTQKNKTFFFYSEEFRLEKTPTEYDQAVPGLKERGLILSPTGAIQQNIQTNGAGISYQAFDFSDVCPVPAATFVRSQYPDCPSVEGFGIPVNGTNILGSPDSPVGVDKNALAILDSNLIPLPNAPYGCNFSLPNLNADLSNLDPQDPNHCYVNTVSPSTYWREELFRLDQNISNKVKATFRYTHDEWDTNVLTPQWGVVRNTFPTVQNRFYGPGVSLVVRFTDTISPSFLNDIVLNYVNSGITLTDENGPGGAQFQRNPELNQPLIITNPSNPSICNPAISVDPNSGYPQCAMGYIFNNGFGGKNPGVDFQGTNAAYGGEGFAADPSYMPWGHSSPTYGLRDDLGKSIGRHTLQFGAQYVYYQRNQDNNAIGAASGDKQGLLKFNNLAHSTGNAFADFLVQSAPGGSASGENQQGFIQSFTQDSTQLRYYQRYQLAEPYFQDDWKMTQRLTVNLGLRVSLFGLYHEKNRNAWNWVASGFSSGRFAVDPIYGDLLDCGAGAVGCTSTTGSPLPISEFSPGNSLVSAMGLVQCGTGSTPAGCMKGHLFNPAPRVGFAWDPWGTGKTSIRGGYGIFFEHGTGNEANTGSLEASAPLVLSMTQQFPTSYSCIGDVGYGNATSPECNSVEGGTAPPAGIAFPLDVTSIPTKVSWPYAQQWSFGVQRELSKGVMVNLAYVGSKGTKLTVERQLNQLAPLPVSQNPFGPNEPLTITDCTVPAPGVNGAPGSNGIPFFLMDGTQVTPTNPAYVYLQAACTNPSLPNVNALHGRPYPGLGRVLSLENGADSSYHALQATLRHTSGGLTTGVSYSYSHSLDDASDRSDPILANSYDLRENRASSNFDERHLLNISYVYKLPLKELRRRLFDWAWDPVSSKTAPKCCSTFENRLLDGWEFSGVTLFQSGTPFTVINSAGNTGISVTDNAGVSSGLGIAASYPDILRGLPSPGNNQRSFGPLLSNPSQFVAPRGLTFGDAGRNYLNNPSRLNFDVSVLKHFRIQESRDLEFRAEAFNVFNHTEFRVYDPDNPGSTGNNIISCYAGPFYSAGFQGKGADCVTGASFLHPLDAHRSRTIQVGLKLAF